MLATTWVAPGEGDTAGFLWDLAIQSKALYFGEEPELREDFLAHGVLTGEQRSRRTRLQYRADLMLPLEPYDVERIMCAVWEYDRVQEEVER